jgi:transposase
VLKTRKIKILPTGEQKKRLNEWFDAYIHVYNKGVHILINKLFIPAKKGKEVKKPSTPVKRKIRDIRKVKKTQTGESGVAPPKKDHRLSLLQQMREKIVKKHNYGKDDPVSKLPADTRDYALSELLQAYWTSNGVHGVNNYTLNFKKRHASTSINMRRRQYNQKSGIYTWLSQIKTAEELPELKHDIKIHRNESGDFYLLLAIDVIEQERTIPKRIISIDPGIRTFLTGYSPDGMIYKIGDNDIGRLSRLLHHRNKIQALVAKHRRKNKNRIKKAYKKSCNRIKDLVSECHKKSTKWLLDNFDTILVPKLDTNGLCRNKKGKKISKRTKSKIKVWRHCEFINRLTFKASCDYRKNRVIIPPEDFTSKTCSSCGALNGGLGSSRTFKCPRCCKCFDRDINAAKNILLKYITETQVSQSEVSKDTIASMGLSSSSEEFVYKTVGILGELTEC